MDRERGHARYINDKVHAVIRWRKILVHRKKKLSLSPPPPPPPLINSVVYDETMRSGVSKMKEQHGEEEGDKRDGETW